MDNELDTNELQFEYIINEIVPIIQKRIKEFHKIFSLPLIAEYWEETLSKSFKEIGFNKNVEKLVYQQAKLAKEAKLDAIVCSAREVKIVRKVFKKEIITPGIRFNSKLNDQKRVLTPKQAYKNGSDWLVIGRPITKGNIKNNIKTLINHLN